MEEKICRLCLGKNGTISIFDKQDDIQYSEKIMHFVKITITVGDDFPSYICSTCESELAISYEFVLKCESSDRNLRCLDYRSYEESNTKLEINVVKDELDNFDEQQFIYAVDLTQEYESDTDTNDVLNKKKIKCELGKGKRKRRKRHKMGCIQCPICGLLVNSPSAMLLHSRTHTGEKPYPCSKCEASFAAKGTLKRHIETYHSERERKFTCEMCGNRFYRKNDIIIHMRRHTGETPHACTFCPRRFQQASSLIRHTRTHTGDKPYSCHVCEKRFADKSMVSKHMSVHSNEKKFTCQLCHKSMKSKPALRVHLNLHSNEKLNVCNFCGMAFAAKGNLKMHISRVHSEKSGQCNICLKTFSNLETHMWKHTGEKPFECNICCRAFSMRKSLTNHMLFKHENVSKYKCSISECSKTFPTPSMLEYHLLKQHSNHTPFICQHCSRGFFRSSDLSRHLRVSHNEQRLTQISKLDRKSSQS